MKDETAKKVLERLEEMDAALAKTKNLIANIHNYINQANTKVEVARLTIRQSRESEEVSHG